MSENKLAERIAKEFEKELTNFLNLSWLEKLEKAEDFFKNSWNAGGYEKSRKISLMFKEFAEAYKREVTENSSEEYKEFVEFCKTSYFDEYLIEQFDDLLHRLPFYFLFTHIICDNTYHQISYEGLKELREICELQNAKDRRDFFIEFFSFLIRDEIIQGRSEGFWNEANSLYFISWYNRFQIVIKNARKDLEKCRDTNANRKKILEDYKIPEDYQENVFNEYMNPGELSLDWALKLISWKGKDSKKALRKAKEKAGKYQTHNSKKLISVYKLNLNLAYVLTTLSPKERAKLRFPDITGNSPNTLFYL